MSPQFRLDANDWQKIGTGALIALAGALLTWLATTVAPILAGKYPEYAPIIGAIAAVLLNIARKYFTDTRPTLPQAAAAAHAASCRVKGK